MKLASLKQGRDGRLVVVSDDLAWCAAPPPMYPTLQSALDDWDRAAPVLEGVALSLSHDAVPHARFHEREAAAPLPRAYQWVLAAVGAAGQRPVRQQLVSDQFAAPRDGIAGPGTAGGFDMAAAVVVITGDVPQGASAEAALAAIRLVGLAHLSAGPGPGAALSPALVTPEALGERWSDGRLRGQLAISINGQMLAAPADAAADAAAGADHFGTLIAQLAASGRIGAGSIIAAGPVARFRLTTGDLARIEMLDDHHHSLFGAIEQLVA